MSPVAGIPSDVGNIAGPVVIAFMLGSILYGVQVLQVYTYYLAFPKDRKFIKTVVYLVFFLDTTQTVIFLHDAFEIFGSGFGDMDALRVAHLSGLSVPIMTGLVSFIVQSCYSYQIHVISQSWILPLIIVSVALTQFVGALIEGVLVFEINNQSFVLQQRTLVPCTIWLVGSAVCDTIIATTMIYYLVRSSSSLKGNVVIARLVRLVIETGSLTASVAIIDAVLFISVQTYPFHMIPARCLAKLYSNTLMVILNSRMEIKGSRDGVKALNVFCIESSVSTIRFGQNPDSKNEEMQQQHAGASTSLAGLSVETDSRQIA